MNTEIDTDGTPIAVAAPKPPRYRVNFKGKGFTAPNAQNPNGIKVTAEGYVIVEGERPARNFDIPMEVVARCKQVFMEQTMCARYEGDEPRGPGKLGVEKFPTVWLGKVIK